MQVRLRSSSKTVDRLIYQFNTLLVSAKPTEREPLSDQPPKNLHSKLRTVLVAEAGIKLIDYVNRLFLTCVIKQDTRLRCQCASDLRAHGELTHVAVLSHDVVVGGDRVGSAMKLTLKPRPADERMKRCIRSLPRRLSVESLNYLRLSTE